MAGRILAAVTSLPGRALISSLLLGVVLLNIDLGAVGDAVGGARWVTYGFAIAVIAVSFVIGATRWQALLLAAGIEAGAGASLRAYFAGAFSNNLLPTGFGGDFVREWLVTRSGRPLARALASVLYDRATALACLVGVGWIGVVADPGAVPGTLVALLGAVTGAGAIAALVAGTLLRRGGLGALLPGRVRPWAGEAAVALRAILADAGLQLRVLALGVLFQTLVVLALWLIADTIGLEVALAALAVVVPLVLIATVAPISIAGFGVREGAFVGLLAEVGISAAEATVLSLLSAAGLAIASLPGAAWLAAPRERPGDGRAEASSEARAER